MVARSWLGRAIFLFPIVLVMTYTFGLAFLIAPYLEASHGGAQLLPVASGPLSERLSGLGATGMYWLGILLTGNQVGMGRTIVRVLTGMAVPETASMQELFEQSTLATPTFSSESLWHAAWS